MRKVVSRKPFLTWELPSAAASTRALGDQPFKHQGSHYGLLDPKIPYKDPIKGRLRYPSGLIAHSGSSVQF